MSDPKQSAGDLTTLLQAWRAGSGTAFGYLFDQVYDEIKVVATKRLNQMGRQVT